MTTREPGKPSILRLEGAAMSPEEIDAEVATLGLGHVVDYPPSGRGKSPSSDKTKKKSKTSTAKAKSKSAKARPTKTRAAAKTGRSKSKKR